MAQRCDFSEPLCALQSNTAQGIKIYIEGQLETRKWQDQSGQDRYSTEVVLRPYTSTLTMLDGRGDNAAVAAVMAVDQAAVAMQGYDGSPHLRIPMVADRVHQTTWTTKSVLGLTTTTQKQKGAEISALRFDIFQLLRGDCGTVCAAFHQFLGHKEANSKDCDAFKRGSQAVW